MIYLKLQDIVFLVFSIRYSYHSYLHSLLCQTVSKATLSLSLVCRKVKAGKRVLLLVEGLCVSLLERMGFNVLLPVAQKSKGEKLHNRVCIPNGCLVHL